MKNMVAIGIVVVIIVIAVAAVALTGGKGSSATTTTARGSSGTGSGTGTGGSSTNSTRSTSTTSAPTTVTSSTSTPSTGYVVNCTPYYLQGLPSAGGNLTCSDATLNGGVLSFQTMQDSGLDTNVSFYLTSASGNMGGTYVNGFYINSASPVNATWSPGQTLTVTFDLTPQQVSSLIAASKSGAPAGVGWNWDNATSQGNGGIFASLTALNG